MALSAVVFDVGETLVDEERWCPRSRPGSSRSICGVVRGRLQPTPQDVCAIDSLAEPPGALASLT